MNDDRPAIVLLHGVGLDHTIWSSQVKALEAHMRVITYDLLCHGTCPKPDHPVGLTHFVDQLKDVLAAEGLDQASIAGFSFGGMIAQAFAASHPEQVAKLVIIGAVYRRSPEQLAAIGERLATAEREGTASMMDAALKRWYSDAFRAAHPERIEAICDRLRRNVADDFLAAYRVFIGSDYLIAGRLKRITAPSLVIAGELDPGSTPAMAERMALEIPDARLKVIAGGQHMLPDEWADEINAEMAGFLTG